MTVRPLPLLAGAALALVASAAPGADSCSMPAQTVLTDPAGDWSGIGGNFGQDLPAGAGTPEQDLLSLSVEQVGGNIRFTIQLAGAPAQLLPNAAWFSSFETPDGSIYGVRMETDSTATPAFFSYRADASTGGIVDGRFVAEGSVVPAEAASALDGDKVVIVVKPESIGVFDPGQTLGPFNAASMQGVSVAGAGGAAAVIDSLPDNLSRDGSYDLCGSGDKGLFATGAMAPLTLGTFGWFAAVLTLRRWRRDPRSH
ncbi:MAG TPA: hypothetical protein VM369_01875 [Candidatus Binatia bacterium]|nr:hypothetical protein [Candidatus Binatia bacterium]